MKLTVLGPGCWGLTLAWLLTDNFDEITVWGRESDLYEDLVVNKHCSRPLEIQLDKKIEITSDLESAIKDAEIILSVVATVGMRDVCEKLKSAGIKSNQILVNASKGIELNTLLRMSEVIKDVLPEQKVEYLLEPIISDKSVTMLYAPAGIGKTWFTMCVALAVSRGQALFSNMPQEWVAAKPHRVAYLDSEMTEYHFKTRLRTLAPIYSSPRNAKALSFKLVAEDSINLLDEEKNHCDKITQWLNDEADRGKPVELLILDNLSTLTGFNDSAKAWDTVFAWLKTLKNKVKNRCSTIVIHHSNKKGDQRGSSAKTATVDNVIKLEREESASDKMQFKITVEKGRDVKQIPSPFSVVLHLPTEKRAIPSFKRLLPITSQKKSASTRTKDAIAYLIGEKKIPHDVIAALTDLSPAYIRQLSHDLKKK